MKFLIVTGLSGAGKTRVLRHLEDNGYQCMDNMPPMLLESALSLCEKVELERNVALVVDSRCGSLFDAKAVLRVLDNGAESHKVSLLFLEADTETLISRYKETRREHPLAGDDKTLEEAIAWERELLQPLRERKSCPLVSSEAFPAKAIWCWTFVSCPTRFISAKSAPIPDWKSRFAITCWRNRKPRPS